MQQTNKDVKCWFPTWYLISLLLLLVNTMSRKKMQWNDDVEHDADKRMNTVYVYLLFSSSLDVFFSTGKILDWIKLWKCIWQAKSWSQRVKKLQKVTAWTQWMSMWKDYRAFWLVLALRWAKFREIEFNDRNFDVVIDIRYNFIENRYFHWKNIKYLRFKGILSPNFKQNPHFYLLSYALLYFV